MSQNVEIIRKIYEAANLRDWDAAFRDQHPDVELVLPPGSINLETYRGREEIQAYWEDMLAAFEAVAVEPEDFFAVGDQVAVVIRTRAQLEGSSAEIEIRNGHLWTIDDGRVRSMRLFPEPEKALEALRG